jgi:large conductance mechanosensitive channel
LRYGGQAPPSRWRYGGQAGVGSHHTQLASAGIHPPYSEACMFKEFKEFVNQGNALDLAVGVMIGAAFGKIVNSIVTDLIMPVLSIQLGAVNFANKYIPLAGQAYDLAPADRKGPVFAYGAFIQNVIEFLVVAFTIFLVVRQINKWRGTTPKKA